MYLLSILSTSFVSVRNRGLKNERCYLNSFVLIGACPPAGIVIKTEKEKIITIKNAEESIILKLMQPLPVVHETVTFKSTLPLCCKNPCAPFPATLWRDPRKLPIRASCVGMNVQVCNLYAV